MSEINSTIVTINEKTRNDSYVLIGEKSDAGVMISHTKNLVAYVREHFPNIDLSGNAGNSVRALAAQLDAAGDMLYQLTQL